MFSLISARRIRGIVMVLSGIACALLVAGGTMQTGATVQYRPTEPLVSDQSFVFHPDLYDFDVEEFLRRHNSGLLGYVEADDEDGWTAVEAIEFTALRYSISPHLLLALLEMHTGAVTSPALDYVAVDRAFGFPRPGFQAQLDAAAQTLFMAYYGFRGDADVRATWSAGMNAGTAAVTTFLNDTSPDDATRTRRLGRESGSFHAIFQELFGDPLAGRLVNATPTAPMPGGRLPWTSAETWRYTGGPHNTNGKRACTAAGCATPWSSIDIAPPEVTPCPTAEGSRPDKYPPNRWAVAVRDGNIVSSRSGIVRIDHGDGWATQYVHLANDGIVTAGAIGQSTPVGHPSCNYSGGLTTGVHLHFSVLYNGEYQNIHSTNLGGWTVEQTAHYNGRMTCPDGRVRVASGGTSDNLIADDCRLPASATLSVVLVIDSSGSMATNDPGRLRVEAVKAFIDAAQIGDEIGIVDFSSSSRTLAPMTIIKGNADKAALKAAADRVRAYDSTNINAGLNTGFTLLSAAAGNAQKRAAILLTDGDHNVGSYNNQSHLQYADKGWAVYTVGLGQANQTLMARIADDTGGRCVNNCKALTDPAVLGALYQSMRASLTSSNSITQQQAHVKQGETHSFQANVSPNQFSTQFYVGWQGSEMELSLVAPGGLTIDADNLPANVSHAKGATYELFQVDFPQPGQWTMSVYGKDVPSGGESVNVFASTQGMSYLYQPMSISVPPTLTNGNFEAGRGVGWQEYSSNNFALVTKDFSGNDLTPYSGNWAAWLGGVYDETSILSQLVTVPAATPVLNYYQAIQSYDDCGNDRMTVRVGGNDVVKADLCRATNTGGWVRRSINLSSHAGKTVILEFVVTTNDKENSNLFIDDVSFVSVAAAQQPEESVPAAGGVDYPAVLKER